MALALLYNRQDLSVLAAEATRTDLPPADRKIAQALWNGGLKNWSGAVAAPVPFQDGGPDNPTLLMVLDGTVTKAQIVEWLHRLAATSGSYYLAALAQDVNLTAIEPWPPA